MAENSAAEKSAEDIQRLFVELREAYERVALALPSAESFSDAATHARFLEESGKVSAIIRRIKEIQDL